MVSLSLMTILSLAIYSQSKKANNTTPPPKSAATAKPTVVEDSYTLTINKTNITAPIIVNVDGNNKEAYDKSLESGVAQLNGTALPGKAGNTFIFGHSSFYTWKPGEYKKIFKDLNNLETGDEIIINSNVSRYIYRVSDKQIVMPDRVDVVDQNYSEKKLTLMTCWPIGSSEKRLVVIAMLTETIPIQ